VEKYLFKHTHDRVMISVIVWVISRSRSGLYYYVAQLDSSWRHYTKWLGPL